MVRDPIDERGWWDEAFVEEAFDVIWTPAHKEWTWESGVLHSLIQIVPALRAVLHDGARILDLGCGPGRVAIPLAKLLPYVQVVGVDISKEILDEGRARRNLADCPNLDLYVGDGRIVDVIGGPFDAAYSMLMFQHVEAETVKGYLHEVARQLKPGGVFRFQFTVGPSSDLYAQDHDVWHMHSWVRHAGLEAVGVEHDPDYPTWRWITAEKTS